MEIKITTDGNSEKYAMARIRKPSQSFTMLKSSNDLSCRESKADHGRDFHPLSGHSYEISPRAFPFSFQ